MSYVALADAYLIKGQHDNAVEAAMSLRRRYPGDAGSQITLGFFLHWAGRGVDAVRMIKKGLKLDPKYIYSKNPMYLDFLGYACFTAGLYEDSFNEWEESIENFGPIVPRQAFLIAACNELGRDQEARVMARQFMKKYPNFTLKSWKLARMYKNFEDTERLLNALRKAGLK
jgi:tetratricopeptide (TPR) repeat protein